MPRGEKLPMVSAVTSLPSVPLQTLMNWVQAVVVHPHCVDTAVCDDGVRAVLDVSPDRVGDVILPSRTLTPSQRLNIYAGMYPMRMRDALKTDFPVVQGVLGDDGFMELVNAYIVEHFSVHPNLNQLGRKLPEFIRASKHIKNSAFLAEMAELEQAMVEVFDGPDTTTANVDDLTSLAPEAWSDAVFHPVESFRLLTFQYPVNAYLQAFKSGKDVPAIKKSQSYTAVYRKNFVVWRYGLTRPQYRILKLLSEGKTVFDALLKGAKGGGSDVATMAQQLRGWFSEWFTEGWFSRIEIRADTSDASEG